MYFDTKIKGKMATALLLNWQFQFQMIKTPSAN